MMQSSAWRLALAAGALTLATLMMVRAASATAPLGEWRPPWKYAATTETSIHQLAAGTTAEACSVNALTGGWPVNTTTDDVATMTPFTGGALHQGVFPWPRSDDGPDDPGPVGYKVDWPVPDWGDHAASCRNGVLEELAAATGEWPWSLQGCAGLVRPRFTATGAAVAAGLEIRLDPWASRGPVGHTLDELRSATAIGGHRVTHSVFPWLIEGVRVIATETDTGPAAANGIFPWPMPDDGPDDRGPMGYLADWGDHAASCVNGFREELTAATGKQPRSIQGCVGLVRPEVANPNAATMRKAAVRASRLGAAVAAELGLGPTPWDDHKNQDEPGSRFHSENADPFLIALKTASGKKPSSVERAAYSVTMQSMDYVVYWQYGDPGTIWHHQRRMLRTHLPESAIAASGHEPCIGVVYNTDEAWKIWQERRGQPPKPEKPEKLVNLTPAQAAGTFQTANPELTMWRKMAGLGAVPRWHYSDAPLAPSGNNELGRDTHEKFRGHLRSRP